MPERMTEERIAQLERAAKAADELQAFNIHAIARPLLAELRATQQERDAALDKIKEMEQAEKETWGDCP